MNGTTKFILSIAGLIIAIYAFAWGLGWATMPFEKTSVENVQAQWAFAYSYQESLKSEARQVCTAEKALAGATEHDEKMQRESQLEVLEQNYARIEAEYDAKLRNAFEAKYVKPSDVPHIAPTLVEMKEQVCQ
jgi:hypothetical protein